MSASNRNWRSSVRQLFENAPTEADPERTVLGKHLATYTAKNTFDYFIHKDLGKFLESELDLYLNTEVLNLDDITLGDEVRLNRALLRARAVRHVAKKIIAFLAQLENFQKQLYLKKKFILDTQYCVTLDRVPEALHAEIAKNKAQREEWARLLAVDEDPLTPEFLKANPYLVLDTRHFGRDFTDELLSALSDAGPLDEQMDGLLIHGENFQALNLLQERYAQQVKCVYIDPPYNTDTSAILYKNDYKHSSWLSLMDGRLLLTPALMTANSVLCVAIDDEEVHQLKLLMDSVLGSERHIGTVAVQSNPGGRDINTHFAISHEYCLFYANSEQQEMLLPRESIDAESERTGPFRRTGGLASPEERENSEFAFYYDPKNLTILGIGGKRAFSFPADYEPTVIHCLNAQGEVTELNPSDFFDAYPGVKTLLPVFKNGDRGVWRWSDRNKILSAVKQNKILLNNRRGKISVQLTSQVSQYYKPKTIWSDSAYSASTHGTVLLQHIFGEKGVFPYPKSINTVQTAIAASTHGHEKSLILDYFAGAGTTAHAVVNLNREDGGQRKYILVEMGEHFEDVLLPRLKKVVYSKDWKEGKPVSREGVTQFFKCIRLESYEDTLDGLELTSQTEAQQEMLADGSSLAEDYQLRYALGVETADSAALLGKDFTDPWVYKLSVVRDGEREDADADLPETFNYLIGLRVERRKVVDDVLVIVGTDAGGRRCLLLWRDTTKTDNDKLNEWFKSNCEEYGEIDMVYVNGDHNINAVVPEGKTWVIKPIEPTLRELMFGRDD